MAGLAGKDRRIIFRTGDGKVELNFVAIKKHFLCHKKKDLPAMMPENPCHFWWAVLGLNQ